jgi:hypothetical protein
VYPMYTKLYGLQSASSLRKTPLCFSPKTLSSSYFVCRDYSLLPCLRVSCGTLVHAVVLSEQQDVRHGFFLPKRARQRGDARQGARAAEAW